MSVSNIIDFDQANMLKAALGYAAKGWSVLPCWGPIHDPDGKFVGCGCKKASCDKPGKHPHGFLVPRGQMQATTDEAIIRKWFSGNHRLNIGILCSTSGLCTVDIDPRNGGYLTLEMLEAQHGKISSDVHQLTGGGGEHFVFSNPYGVNGLPNQLGPGVDVKANGYFIAWPSIHQSGRMYEWEASSDPLNGCVPSPLPEFMRDIAHKGVPLVQESLGSRLATEEQIKELRSALKFVRSDDYHDWVNFGQALKDLGAAGYELWDEWSQTSDKYDKNLMGFKWRSFKSGAYQLESIFHEAQTLGWINPMSGIALVEPVAIEEVQHYVPPAEKIAPPLIRIDGQSAPGILEDVVSWIEASSRKSQPDFSLQAALAFASTLLGRRYVTTQRNWSALYFLNIGKSGSGKEHAKWAIETLLEACGQPHLIGPAGYTSDSGVLSTLCKQPVHCSVIDEFGKVLEGASIKHGARSASTMKALMEVWGRCDGVMRPQGYSTFGMSDSDAQKMSAKTVRNPSLTLLAMTTPETFFDSIGSAAARDGFLNRFLMVETDIGRQAGRHTQKVSISPAIIEWAQRSVNPSSTLAMVNPAGDATLSPTPIVVPFSPQAMDMFGQFEEECINLMDEYEVDGLAEMWSRSNEIAMRVSLIAAVSSDSSIIQEDHAAWSIAYVRRSFMKVVNRLKTCLFDSEFESISIQVLEVIRLGGKKGRTDREIHQYCRKFRGLDHRGKQNVLSSLAMNEDIVKVDVPSLSGRGRPRGAWISVAVVDSVDNDNYA